jgi:uncharacterized protein involved in outer membrane biogenesis
VRLIFLLLTTIVVVVAIFFVGPLFISADEVRNQLFAQIESATGYRLWISGPLNVTLFPSFHLVAEGSSMRRLLTSNFTAATGRRQSRSMQAAGHRRKA